MKLIITESGDLIQKNLITRPGFAGKCRKRRVVLSLRSCDPCISFLPSFMRKVGGYDGTIGGRHLKMPSTGCLVYRGEAN